MLNKILKNVSAFLVAIIIVNSFMFAILVSPKPAKAITGAPDATLAITVQTAKQSVWESIKKVWEGKESVLTKAYRTADLSFQAWEKSEGILGKVSYTLMYITVNIMLAKMTQDIVKWIDGGAKGSPKIFQDFDEDLANAADLAGGAVIGQLLGIDSKTLCNPDFVKTDLVIAFDKYISPPIFQDKLKCSFTGGLKAWTDFQEDFTKGGWKSWIELSRRENNQLGTFMMTQEELGKSIVAGQSKVKQEIDLGGGFKPQEVCRVTKNIDMGTYAANQSALLEGFGGSGQELIGESVVAARQGSRGATETAFTLGAELKDLMPKFNWPGDDLEGFKQYWVSNGGEFKCKIQTPAQIIADITSKAITGPFEAMNDAIAASLSNIGKSAPSVLQPYLNAISASAMNLLIKKEKGLISAAIKPTPPRKNRKQDSDSFKDANLTLNASQSLLSSTLSLREMIMKTVLSFSAFTGTVRKLVENKEFLYSPPIVPDEVNDNGLISNYIAYWASIFKLMIVPDPIISPVARDGEIARETSRVVNAKILADRPFAFPTLPIAGTMDLVGESCSSPVQEIEPKGMAIVNTTLSTYKGFIDPATGGLVTSGDGWYNGVRVTAFDDSGDSSPDRFVRETNKIGGNGNMGPSDIATFIDIEGHSDAEDKNISDGIRPAYPYPNTIDPIYSDEYEDPRIFTSELAAFNIQNEINRKSNGIPAQRIYYIGPNNTIATDDALGGNIFVIENSRYSTGLGDVFQINTPINSCIDDTPALKYTKNGSVGIIHAGGAQSNGLNFGYNCGGINYSNPIATIDWGQFTSESVTITAEFDGSTSAGCNNAKETVIITVDDLTPDGIFTFGPRLCTGNGSQTPDVTSISISSAKSPLKINSDPNTIGVQAYYEDSNYWLKFFSPVFEGATAQIQNSRRTVLYDDFKDNTGGPRTLRNIATRKTSTVTSTVTLEENTPYVNYNNPNPYKMSLISFYDQLQETLNDFTVKIRILLGYTQMSEEKTYLSGLADQIGAVPDDDPTSTSTSDVLIKYNNLSNLYQTLFTGVSSEETLEGIDPDYEILNPTETNIRLALIGQKCPAIPPTSGSSPELIDGCGRFGADPTNTLTRTTTGEYNMAKRFIFQRNMNTGFATNPFTNELSSPLAGILNLDEMARQLASLPPDKNVIKLIRIRQILEQLQISPGEIKIEGKKSGILPPALTGVDVVKVSLRNYPEIEAYLNDITTADKPITDLTSAYGYEDPADAKKAYPIISNDLEEVLPDIVTQISDKLKDVFLKRTELELENAKTEARERLLDFVYYAYDLNPAVQLQLDGSAFGNLPGVTMKMGDVDNKIIRVVASQADALPYITHPDGSDFEFIDGFGNDASGAKHFAPSNIPFPGLGPCISISGDQIECGTAEFALRGFETVPWGQLRDNISIISNGSSSQTAEETLGSNIAIRQALMASIKTKIKKFNEMIGIDTTSIDFENKISSYELPISKDPVTGNSVADTARWDYLIEKGLRDVDVLFTGLFSKNLPAPAVGDPPLNYPGDMLYFNPPYPINNDIKTKMEKLGNDFSLLQNEVEKIIDMFSSMETTGLMSAQSDMEEISVLIAKMDSEENKALACVTARVHKPSNVWNIVAGGAAGTGIAYYLALTNPVTAIAAGLGMLAGAIYDSIWGKKKRKKKAKKAAEKCNAAAYEYNKALLQLTNKFVCGQTWQEPQQ